MTVIGTPRARRRPLSSALALVRASHPGPVATVSLVAVGYALAIGCDRKTAVRIGTAVFTGQLAVGWHNDWTDADRDRRGGRHDKPIPLEEISRRSVGLASIVASSVCVPASLSNGRRSGLAHLAAVLSAASYNAKLKATPASFLPYGVSFALLPITVYLGVFSDGLPPIWAPATAGTLGLAAHLLNVLPDRELDRAMGILGLPQRLSRPQCLVAAGVLLALSSMIVSFGPKRTSVGRCLAAGVSLGIGAFAVRSGRRHNDKSAFRLVLVLALVDVAQLLVLSRGQPVATARRDHRGDHR